MGKPCWSGGNAQFFMVGVGFSEHLVRPSLEAPDLQPVPRDKSFPLSEWLPCAQSTGSCALSLNLHDSLLGCSPYRCPPREAAEGWRSSSQQGYLCGWPSSFFPILHVTLPESCLHVPCPVAVPSLLLLVFPPRWSAHPWMCVRRPSQRVSHLQDILSTCLAAHCADRFPFDHHWVPGLGPKAK